MDRRIAAFIEKQRVKMNFANIQEFCGVARDQGDMLFTQNSKSKACFGCGNGIVEARQLATSLE